MSARLAPSPLKRAYVLSLCTTALITLIGYLILSKSIESAPMSATMHIERVFVAIMLLVLTIEGLFIFRPVDNLIQQQQTALQESEARYQALIAAMAEGMVVQDKDGTIIVCNPAAEMMLGLTSDQMMGRTSIDSQWHCIHEDGSSFPGETHPAMFTLRTGRPQQDIVMGVHTPDSNMRWILINSMPLLTQDASMPYAVVVTFSDITQHKALVENRVMTEKLQTALEKERELSGLKSRMMERITHEFRTPLASIQISSETLVRYGDRLTQEQKQTKAQTIKSSITHITTMLDKISAAIRGTFAQEPLRILPMNLVQVCREAQVTLEAQLKVPGKLVIDIPTNLSVSADPLLLGRVFYHVLHNAIRFSPPGTPVQLSAVVDGAMVALRVTNSGIGILPDEQAQVFEPFFRGSNIGEVSGLGLGLTVVQAGITALGGRIAVESTPGERTTFIVRLPLTTSEECKES
jgi:PAS domain S-box-containing protein